MPLWILFFTALTLALHSVPAEAPEPEPSAPVEVVLTKPVFRAETGLPMYPDYTLDKDLLVWAEEYEASTGTPVVMYDLRAARPPAVRAEPSPAGRNLFPPPLCHTKKSPACRKARSRRGICFL